MSDPSYLPPGRGRRHAPYLRSVVVAAATLATTTARVEAQEGFAPRFGVDRWTTEDGLPSETIGDLVQSGDGYLWMIASGWIVRFDGNRFATFWAPDTSAARLPGGRPFSLAAGRGDTVFAVTSTAGRSDVIRFAGGRAERIASVPGVWTEILLDATGDVWLGSSTDLVRLDGDRLAKPLRAALTRVGALDTDLGPQRFLDRSGDVWLRDPLRDSIGVLRGGQVRFTEPATFPLILERPSSGEVLFPSVAGDTVVIRDPAGAELAAFRRKPGALPRLVDRSGRLWVTTPGALEVYAAGSPKPIATVPLPAGTQVSGLLEDRDGDLWARTWTRGLFRIRELVAHVISTEDGLRTKQVTMVARGRAGSMLATDPQGRLYRISGSDVRVISDPDSTPPGGPGGAAVRVAMEDRRGTLWLALFDGRRESPYALIGRREGRRPIIDTVDVDTRVIVEDPRDDGSLWFGAPTVYHGRASPTSLVLTDTFPVATEPIRDLAIDANGAVWIPADSALVRIAGDSVTEFRGPGYKSRVARSILIDPDGTIWIGTYSAGLLRFRDGTFRSVTEADGLAENVVSSILDDGAGNLWMAGNRSVHRVSRTDLDAFLDGERDHVDGVAYTRRDGLRNPETSGYEAARDDAGRLWFPTFDGIAVIDPARARALERDTPLVHIEGIRLAGGQTRLPEGQEAAHAELAANERRFEVDYTAISLRDPEAVRYRYRLDGFDDTWRDAGHTRTATYTNVKAGRYTFRLQAVSGAGVPAREATLSVMVQPFFYETNTFLALVALALLASGMAIVRFRERRHLARQAELNRLVDERTAALAEESRRTEAALLTVEAQAERLRSLDRARSRFFANVSHEFRTPLTLIAGPLRDLREGRLGELPPAVKREIDLVLDSGQRLNALVEQLLDIARLEVGELKLEPRTEDIVPFLRRIARSFDPLARARGISLEVELPDASVPVVFDPDRLEKVLTNLLGNAFKFTDRGGQVRLVAGVQSVADRDALLIRIEDDGIGIPEHALARVFDRFYQVDDSPSRQHEGTGVGLALAKELVELHGGAISVESEVGVGSTFTVRLPLLQDSPLQARADDGRLPDDAIGAAAVRDVDAMPEVGQELDGRDVTTVLLVEDNARVRAYLRRHLEERYRVLEAADGRAGLELARRVVPDLVISDVMMPDMDGQTMVEEIRHDPDVDFLPVILLTAKASHESMLTGLRGGADDYITKPFDIEELLLRAHNLIAGRRKLRERFQRERRTLPSLPPPFEARRDADARFIERVHEILAEHIDDEDFDVQDLAQALHMSRSTLYRRADGWLGRSPMDVITGFRLEQAARWLRETDAKVNEIAYGVGFKSVPHFSRKFRERFGKTPTEFRQGRD